MSHSLWTTLYVGSYCVCISELPPVFGLYYKLFLRYKIVMTYDIATFVFAKLQLRDMS